MKINLHNYTQTSIIEVSYTHKHNNLIKISYMKVKITWHLTPYDLSFAIYTYYPDKSDLTFCQVYRCFTNMVSVSTVNQTLQFTIKNKPIGLFYHKTLENHKKTHK